MSEPAPTPAPIAEVIPIVEKTTAPAPAPVVEPVIEPVKIPASKVDGINWGMVIGILIVCGAVGYILYKKKQNSAKPVEPTPTNV